MQQNKEMKYIKVINNFEQIKPNIIARVLTFLLPKSNNTNVNSDSILYWFLEVEGGNIKREIGFNQENIVSYKAPSSHNYGIWCDSFVELNNPEDYNEISVTTFESCWNPPL
jgi:hypothetical protein